MTHRVLFLAGSLGFGGAERQMVHHATGLAALGDEVVVASMTRGEHWEVALKERGVEVVHVDATGRVARMVEISRVARRVRPSVVQSAQAFMNLYAVGASRAVGARSIGALRNAARLTVESIGRLGVTALRAPDLLIGNARCHVRDAVEVYGVAADAAAFLPNAVDVSLFTRSDRSARATQPPLVLFAGRLADQKRPLVFVEAMRQLVEAVGPDAGVRCRIVGEGPLRSAVVDAIGDAGLADVCDVAGNQADMPAEFAMADLFVLTSSYEGTPNVVLEAMASGVPVVATAVGGVPDVMDDGVEGIQVPVDHPAATARAVRQLVDGPELRRVLGDAGAARITRDHAPEAVTARLRQLHRQLLEGFPCVG